jgi:hypothetical protein
MLYHKWLVGLVAGDASTQRIGGLEFESWSCTFYTGIFLVGGKAGPTGQAGGAGRACRGPTGLAGGAGRACGGPMGLVGHAGPMGLAGGAGVRDPHVRLVLAKCYGTHLSVRWGCFC